jgi:hypothetical protein
MVGDRRSPTTRARGGAAAAARRRRGCRACARSMRTDAAALARLGAHNTPNFCATSQPMMLHPGGSRQVLIVLMGELVFGGVTTTSVFPVLPPPRCGWTMLRTAAYDPGFGVCDEAM